MAEPVYSIRRDEDGVIFDYDAPLKNVPKGFTVVPTTPEHPWVRMNRLARTPGADVGAPSAKEALKDLLTLGLMAGSIGTGGAAGGAAATALRAGPTAARALPFLGRMLGAGGGSVGEAKIRGEDVLPTTSRNLLWNLVAEGAGAGLGPISRLLTRRSPPQALAPSPTRGAPVEDLPGTTPTRPRPPELPVIRSARPEPTSELPGTSPTRSRPPEVPSGPPVIRGEPTRELPGTTPSKMPPLQVERSYRSRWAEPVEELPGTVPPRPYRPKTPESPQTKTLSNEEIAAKTRLAPHRKGTGGAVRKSEAEYQRFVKDYFEGMKFPKGEGGGLPPQTLARLAAILAGGGYGGYSGNPMSAVLGGVAAGFAPETIKLGGKLGGVMLRHQLPPAEQALLDALMMSTRRPTENR